MNGLEARISPIVRLVLILNRDLVGSMVPTFSYREIAEVGADDVFGVSPHPFALARLKGFAKTFDPHKFEAETGHAFGGETEISALTGRIGSRGETDHDLEVLRWAVWMLALNEHEIAGDVSKGELIDRLLDGIHWTVAKSARKRAGCGAYEPSIGVPGVNLGPGQLRFMITTGLDFDRDRLFDFVAGLLLRKYGEHHFVRSLALYPPSYRIEVEDFVDHWLMVLIPRVDQDSGDVDEEEQFSELALRHLLDADLGVVQPAE